MSTIETISSISSNIPAYNSQNNSDYYIYDEKGNYIGFDYAKYTSDRQIEADNQKDEIPAMKKDANDEFQKYPELKKEKEIENIQSKYAADEIDKQYKEAVLKYASLLNKGVSQEETQIIKAWEEVSVQANKLTSATASNTTVLEGVKEFINNLNNLQSITKYYKNQKDEKEERETLTSLKTAQDIRDEHNKVQVYETNFFRSAVNVYDTEDEAITVDE